MPRIGWGWLAPSPFCAKAELYLIWIGAPYRAAPTLSAAAGPRKKLPWIEDGGEVIADSERILDHLARTRGDPLGEAKIDPARRARHHLARRTAEESLYFALVAERWLDPAVAPAYQRDLLAGLPAPARPLVGAMARRMLTQQLWAQGTGRHPLPEILARGARDVEALAWALGDGPFFAGDAPAAVDAAIWGALANLWYTPVDGALKRAVGAQPALVAWLDRVSARAPLPSPGGPAAER